MRYEVKITIETPNDEEQLSTDLEALKEAVDGLFEGSDYEAIEWRAERIGTCLRCGESFKVERDSLGIPFDFTGNMLDDDDGGFCSNECEQEKEQAR